MYIELKISSYCAILLRDITVTVEGYESVCASGNATYLYQCPSFSTQKNHSILNIQEVKHEIL
jgi:hypothetical protein